MDWRAALSFWEWANSGIGAYHLYTAVAALAIGPVVFLMRKGDIAHRLLGLTYVFAMVTANASSLTMYSFTGALNFFHLFAVLSLATVLTGMIAIVVYGATKWTWTLDLHLQMMPWSYFGLVMAAIAEAATRGLPRLMEGFDNFWTPFFIVVAFAGVAGSILTNRLLKPVRQRWIGVK